MKERPNWREKKGEREGKERLRRWGSRGEGVDTAWPDL